jgi:hypothetical protein
MGGYIHKGLAAGGWQRYSLMEQLANIGAEICRALSYEARGETDKREKALERGLELFDLTFDDSRWRRRLKEITRAREVVCDYFYGGNQYKSTPESLERYFMQFAVATRLRK